MLLEQHSLLQLNLHLPLLVMTQESLAGGEGDGRTIIISTYYDTVAYCICVVQTISEWSLDTHNNAQQQFYATTTGMFIRNITSVDFTYTIEETWNNQKHFDAICTRVQFRSLLSHFRQNNVTSVAETQRTVSRHWQATQPAMHTLFQINNETRDSWNLCNVLNWIECLIQTS